MMSDAARTICRSKNANIPVSYPLHGQQKPPAIMMRFVSKMDRLILASREPANPIPLVVMEPRFNNVSITTSSMSPTAQIAIWYVKAASASNHNYFICAGLFRVAKYALHTPAYGLPQGQPIRRAKPLCPLGIRGFFHFLCMMDYRS